MPKYAVAVGRKVGIFDTYDECKVQIINYPNAKFKKFNTETEAAEFIRKMSISVPVDSIPNTPLNKENTFKPDLIKVEKISPSNTALNNLNNKISVIEQKLDSFIAKATDMMEGISTRMNKLEEKLKRSGDQNELVVAEPPRKKPKVQDMTKVGNFLYSDNGYVKVYTDGACSKNGRMGAKAGIGVWFNESHPLNVSAPVKGPPTNNTAEIQAARIAITQAYRAGVTKLSVHTDSQFLINCITQWIYKWKKNEWKLTSGGPVKNKDELVKLDAAIQSVEAVEWIHVQGHNGILGNEMADSLARQGASQYKTNVTYALSSDD
uniref:Ribonuclease H1 n=1 Tax=Triatoma dimidiata TaxID=72491 RepID=A0A0V0GC64_TRIDM